MKKIEVKILNPESIDQAEKLMVCAARLTQTIRFPAWMISWICIKSHIRDPPWQIL